MDLFEKQDDLEALSKQERAKKHVNSFVTRSRKASKSYLDKCKMLWDEYLNCKVARSSPLQRANLRLPYAWTLVESIVPQLGDAFLSEKPYIKIEGRQIEDMQFEEDMSSFFTFQFEKMDFYPSFITFLKNKSIFGTSVAKVPWRFDQKNSHQTIERYNPLNGEYSREKIKVARTVFDGPDFEPISIFDFYPDWAATKPGDIQHQRGVAHRTFKTLADLKKRQKVTLKDGSTKGIYSNLDKVEAEKSQSAGENSYHNSAYTASKDGIEALYSAKREGEEEVIEYWGMFDVAGDGVFEEYVITVVNEKTVIRCDPNPFNDEFKPFVAGVAYLVPGEFYGIGDIEQTMAYIKEARALRNARLDQANQAVNRMWIIDRNANINTNNLYSRAGGIVHTNDINGIRPMDAPEVPGSSYNELNQIDFDIQNTAAVINPQGSNGMGRGFSRTAHGVQFLQSMTQSRLALKARLIDSLVMKNLCRIMMSLNRQFLMDDQWVRVMNDAQNPFKMLPIDAFNGDYDFSAITAVEKLSQQERQMNLTQSVVPYVQAMESARPGHFNLDNLTKDYLKEFNFKNTVKYINPPEVQQQYQQQQTQSQMMTADANAQSQARAQAQLKQSTIEADMSLSAQEFEQDLTKEVVKKIVEGGVKNGE